MLKKDLRLNKAGQFKFVFRAGRSCVTRYMAAYVVKQETTKIGFIASKKTGNAVRRNRAKRLMREAARRLLPRVKDNFHMILIARKPIVKASRDEVEQSVLYVLRKTGVRHERQ
ncbi:MAG: ribonuclease P protein component [Gracilibacteraceae bacterium]|jgi:ribonuclease P protein component|nr:ribonuclease P protein component [Gracilibacteraceae bacterium]